jgi:hypothetical protein
MPTRQQIIAAIYKVDGTDESHRHDAWLQAFYREACKSTRSSRGDAYRKYDQGLPSATRAVDPDDHDHRSQHGSPDVNVAGGYASAQSILDRPIETAADWKRTAMAAGYDPRVRAMLREKSELVGPQVLATFEKAWAYGEEASESTRGDQVDQQIQSRRLASQQLASPSFAARSAKHRGS